MDGDISPVVNEFGGLVDMMLDFFQASSAEPSQVLGYEYVHSTDAKLPENPYLENIENSYTVLSPHGFLHDIKLPPHIEDKLFRGTYFNNKTGMPDLMYDLRFVQPSGWKDGDGSWEAILGRWNPKPGETPLHLNPKYEDPAAQLPPLGHSFEYWKNQEIEKGIFLPIEHAVVRRDGQLFHKATYNNIRVKLV